jgi:hypothetical protein
MKLQPRSGKALIDLVRRAGWPVDEPKGGGVVIVRPPGGGAPIPISPDGDRTSASRNLGQLRRAGFQRALERVERQDNRRRERNGQEHERTVAEAAQAAQAAREAHEQAVAEATQKRQQAEALAWLRERRQQERDEQERLFGALSPAEVADVLDLTSGRVYQLLGAGQLVGTRVPNARGRLEWCIAWDDVVAYDAARGAP